MSPRGIEPSASVPQVTLDQRSNQIGLLSRAVPSWSPVDKCRVSRGGKGNTIAYHLSTSPISASRQDSFHVDQSLSHQ